MSGLGVIVVAAGVWITPIANDPGMTRELARAVALHGPRDAAWHVAEPGNPDDVVIRIERAADSSYEIRLEQHTAVVTADDGATPDSLAQALLIKCQFLLEQHQTPEPDLGGAEVSADTGDWLAVGLATRLTTGLQEDLGNEYLTMGPAIHASVRLVKPIWITVEGSAHLYGAGEVETSPSTDVAYRFRAFPVTVTTGAMWSRGRFSFGGSGGVAFIPLRVDLDTGAVETQQVFGATVRAHGNYEFVSQWYVFTRVGVIVHGDEVDVQEASQGILFALPSPLVGFTLGLERRF